MIFTMAIVDIRTISFLVHSESAKLCQCRCTNMNSGKRCQNTRCSCNQLGGKSEKHQNSPRFQVKCILHQFLCQVREVTWARIYLVDTIRDSRRLYISILRFPEQNKTSKNHCNLSRCPSTSTCPHTDMDWPPSYL